MMQITKSNTARRLAGAIALGAALLAAAVPAASASPYTEVSVYGTLKSCQNPNLTDCKESSFAGPMWIGYEPGKINAGHHTDCYQWAQTNWAIPGYRQQDNVGIEAFRYPDSRGLIWFNVKLWARGGLGFGGCEQYRGQVLHEVGAVAPAGSKTVTLNLSELPGYGSAQAVVTVRNAPYALDAP